MYLAGRSEQVLIIILCNIIHHLDHYDHHHHASHRRSRRQHLTRTGRRSPQPASTCLDRCLVAAAGWSHPPYSSPPCAPPPPLTTLDLNNPPCSNGSDGEGDNSPAGSVESSDHSVTSPATPGVAGSLHVSFFYPSM